jgi:L-lysine exporter family protein LysE/ArgO
MRDFPGTVALVGYGCEVILIAAGVGGLGGFLARFDILHAAHCAAAAFLAICGLRMMCGIGDKSLIGRFTSMPNRRSAVGAMLAVTLLNPLVYIEIVMIGGILSSSYRGTAGWFGAGFLAASALRFFGLSFLGWILAPWLRTTSAREAVSGISGSLLLCVAASQAIAAI